MGSLYVSVNTRVFRGGGARLPAQVSVTWKAVDEV